VPSPLRVEIARSAAELERLRAGWEALRWGREEAAFPYFVARLQSRPGVIGPLAALVSDAGGPIAGLAARLELRQLSTAVGYRVVYAPEVRALQVVDGGFVGERDGIEALVGVVSEALRSGEADVALLPPLELGSALAVAVGSLGGPLTRQPLVASWTRRLLALPANFDEFLVSLSHKSRKGVRRDARRLEEVFDGRLSLAVLRDQADLEQLVGDADRVAASAYQRGLGAGFAATAEQRELARVGLEHGWVRGYLLYLDSHPIAYWLCSVYDRTILLRTGGYDESYAEHRVGIHLLMRVIEDACADQSLDVLDFGPGDASYKQQFSNGSREERDAVVFAPTFRGRRINLTRTAILAPARAAHAALESANLTDRTRARLRGRGTARG
jgi:Acetyltransferase (GNAT) domain